MRTIISLILFKIKKGHACMSHNKFKNLLFVFSVDQIE
jgi:hypothetical protein